MSLDFYLIPKEPIDLKCEHCGSTYKSSHALFSANITHNCNKMAEAANIYKALWRPYLLKKSASQVFKTYEEEIEFEEKNKVEAYEIIHLLNAGLKSLKRKPKFYSKYNSANGWGMYEHFVPFVEEVLNACKQYPDSYVITSR